MMGGGPAAMQPTFKTDACGHASSSGHGSGYASGFSAGDYGLGAPLDALYSYGAADAAGDSAIAA